MRKMIVMAAATTALTACTTDQQGMPLIFARTQNVGVSVAASVPDQGAHLTLGFADRNIAIVPTTSPQGEAIRGVTPLSGGGQFQDALSVLGQFEVTAKGDSAVQAGLGTFFSTGIAARNLAEGFRDKLAGRAPGAPPPPAPAPAPPPNGGN
jgi:hypothetical protein